MLDIICTIKSWIASVPTEQYKHTMVKAKKFIYERPFDGLPKRGDLKLVEEELPSLKDGEFLVEAIYLSVDPYMRIFAQRGITKLGDTFRGQQVGNFGWRNYTIVNGSAKSEQTLLSNIKLLPDLGNLPVSAALGPLGKTGFSAYFGFLDLCRPKAGETVVITTAAGAVGSIVGQIAKIKGCYVIGITGSNEKGKWIVEDLGFDKFINYKKPDLAKTLEEYAPKGIDCYFDNVGGEISSTILNQMNTFGRVSICGSITAYNSKENEYPKASVIQRAVVTKQLRLEGFVVYRWQEKWWSEAAPQITEWINEGKLKYKETITEGFENMFDAFVEMLQGSNFGKALVKA